MMRLLILAVFAIGVFSQIPGLASVWLQENGYMETKANEKTAYSGHARRSGRSEEPEQGTWSAQSGRAILKSNKNGHYFTKAFLNGKPIRVVIDTGATYVALSYEDARRIGVMPQKSDFKYAMSTANGRVYYAGAKIRSVRIGQAEERDIEVRIAPKGALNITLMGMSFLRKLKTFKVENGKLLLES
ncbi:retropepsin-like aspartic protease family protein [Cohaesibacter celericrescens]|uniref:TIGR02281 family clan AA aspartic protease n=1 Tax=Cohaesibacter celericrescens TaxID=2067669 RepID=A0A2N5XMU0_9HYPH|nr:TIGR02281 family clan AA aspartic protease [Cohaesibacter celericrescens]PLW75839.1 hypothetical protein C0081_17195 [Cohaesibacter celericrescens]